RDYVAADLAAIENAIAADASATALCKPLGRFTTARLRDGRKDARWEPSHAFVGPCDALTTAVGERGAAWAARAGTLPAPRLTYARRELAARKPADGIQFYDDLLTLLADALDDPMRGAALADAVRRRYPAALIDEFQDTDPVQYDVVRRIYGDAGCPVVLVGDPKQAIYSFRGADVFSYILARDRAQSHYPLDVNWRADAPLVQAVNTIFAARDRPFLVDKIPSTPAAPAPGGTAPVLSIADDDGAPLRFWWLGDAAFGKEDARERVCAATATQVARLLALGH